MLDVLRIPAGILQQFRARKADSRKDWLRFVAIRLNATEAMPMEPILHPNAIVVIDRHYTSLVRYQPNQATLYAVRNVNALLMRYLDFESNRLVLRPHNPAFPLAVLEMGMAREPFRLHHRARLLSAGASLTLHCARNTASRRKVW